MKYLLAQIFYATVTIYIPNDSHPEKAPETIICYPRLAEKRTKLYLSDKKRPIPKEKQNFSAKFSKPDPFLLHSGIQQFCREKPKPESPEKPELLSDLKQF